MMVHVCKENDENESGKRCTPHYIVVSLFVFHLECMLAARPAVRPAAHAAP